MTQGLKIEKKYKEVPNKMDFRKYVSQNINTSDDFSQFLFDLQEFFHSLANTIEHPDYKRDFLSASDAIYYCYHEATGGLKLNPDYFGRELFKHVLKAIRRES